MRTALTASLLFLLATAPPAGAKPEPPDTARALPIPARAQAAEAPSAGWCGETAIQEALLYLGAWAPQRAINRAGKPSHPDLYSNDVPVALAAFGAKYTFYAARERSWAAFAGWVERALDEGAPVLAGVKILPTQHPEWGLDHFVLVVGHGPRGLLVNTTWGTRAWVSDTATPGLSFKNAGYAIRLDGLRVPARARAARLATLEENASTVRLRASCEGLTPGDAYRIERSGDRGDEPIAVIDRLVAVGDRIEVETAVPADRLARFVCVPR